VRSRIVLKKRDSFQMLASTFGDQLLLQFVEKCNAVLCPEWLHFFQVVYNQNPIFLQKTDASALLDDCCVKVLWMWGTTASPSLQLFFVLRIIYGWMDIWMQVSSIVMRQLKNQTEFCQN
jgi:hypothetical protein